MEKKDFIKKLESLRKSIEILRSNSKSDHYPLTAVSDFYDLRENIFYELQKRYKDDFSDAPFHKTYPIYTSVGHSISDQELVLLGIDIQYYIDILFESVSNYTVEVTKEGFYLNGQVFDAFYHISKLIKQAKGEIIIIDNYIREEIMQILSLKDKDVSVKIITKKTTEALNLLIEKFNRQYGGLEIKSNHDFHDRFLILDRRDYYHFGFSFSDAGSRGSMFSKIEEKIIQDELIKVFDEKWSLK